MFMFPEFVNEPQSLFSTTLSNSPFCSPPCSHHVFNLTRVSDYLIVLHAFFLMCLLSMCNAQASLIPPFYSVCMPICRGVHSVEGRGRKKNLRWVTFLNSSIRYWVCLHSRSQPKSNSPALLRYRMFRSNTDLLLSLQQVGKGGLWQHIWQCLN